MPPAPVSETTKGLPTCLGLGLRQGRGLDAVVVHRKRARAHTQRDHGEISCGLDETWTRWDAATGRDAWSACAWAGF